MNITAIGFSVAACIMLYSAWCVIGPKIKMPDPGVYKNKRKEQKLLSVLLKDMKKNAGNWILQKDQYMYDGPGKLIANDKNNMAVKYSKEGVTIYFNLKDIATLEGDADNTLVTTVNGPQAIKFIKKAISILDHRGKELSYFTKKIEERL